MQKSPPPGFRFELRVIKTIRKLDVYILSRVADAAKQVDVLNPPTFGPTPSCGVPGFLFIGFFIR